jgi:adenosylcobinamide-phosphate synthase
MGRVIGWADRRFNTGENRRLKGAAVMAALAFAATILGNVISAIPDGGILEILIAAVLLAQKSLVDHVRAVADALRLSLGDGRRMVARIVGRDTAAMT